ncbi:hypothetical protein B0H12DRAFT_1072768 [Mycena haematopus]|nr:hypothetical protein B0H12DRAFT_1072768 [Mycena haematopus]
MTVISRHRYEGASFREWSTGTEPHIRANDQRPGNEYRTRATRRHSTEDSQPRAGDLRGRYEGASIHAWLGPLQPRHRAPQHSTVLIRNFQSRIGQMKCRVVQLDWEGAMVETSYGDLDPRAIWNLDVFQERRPTLHGGSPGAASERDVLVALRGPGCKTSVIT